MDFLIFFSMMMVMTVFVLLMVYATRFKRVPPDLAMVIFGAKHKHGVQIVKGGGRFVWPIIEDVDFIPLSVRTLDISVESVVTSKGVMLDVDAVAQVKISSEVSLLKTAAEQLLSKGEEEINYIARRSLEGHVRGICARLTVEEINSDRNKVAAELQDTAGSDLASMGLELVSFTIRDLRDQVGYLHALGKKRTAEVKRDALKGETMALWEGRRLFERYEAAGKGLFVLEKALQELDRSLVAEKGKGLFRILEESGMAKEDIFIIDEILETPGSEGEAKFLERVRKLKVWIKDQDEENKAYEEEIKSLTASFPGSGKREEE